eukprot:CAMPEP_0181525434 /NCGR_PEP_ID=MMETSP1110-20121109/68966_1 /TAXON_ID=174948 /ORGANISM="Symbiodinium sp., Strain CCMP421" /LENGTH=265 /DNA_ID=CAMNT_0023656239 /DNA_START=83 /DNA_END=877 /DNA_ORIENTATION=-
MHALCCEAQSDAASEVLLGYGPTSSTSEVTTGSPSKSHEVLNSHRVGEDDEVVHAGCDPIQKSMLLTFTTRTGESEVEFHSKPLGIRFSHIHPYVVTAKADRPDAPEVSPGWILTHVNGRKLPVNWRPAEEMLREALRCLPQATKKSQRHSAPRRRSVVQEAIGMPAPKGRFEAKSEDSAGVFDWVPAGSLEHSITNYEVGLAHLLNGPKKQYDYLTGKQQANPETSRRVYDKVYDCQQSSRIAVFLSEPFTDVAEGDALQLLAG